MAGDRARQGGSLLSCTSEKGVLDVICSLQKILSHFIACESRSFHSVSFRFVARGHGKRKMWIVELIGKARLI